MKRTPEQERARQERRRREAGFVKCDVCGNTAGVGQTRCIAHRESPYLGVAVSFWDASELTKDIQNFVAQIGGDADSKELRNLANYLTSKGWKK